MTNPHLPVHCKKTFELFGDQWYLVIVDHLRSQPQRFNCLQRNLLINSATLTKKLKRLEELRLIRRSEKTLDNQSVAYELTNQGANLIPIIDQMLSFSKKILSRTT